VEEATGIFSLFGALLERVDNPEAQRELCGGLASLVAATNGTEDVTSREKRSGMLASLFNLRSNGVEKIRLLTKIVDMADATTLASTGIMGEGVSSLSDMLEPSTMEASLAVWGDISEEEKRGLFRAVVKGMDRLLNKLADAKSDAAKAKSVKDVEDRKQAYLLLILGTYKDESSVDNEALTYAQQASIGVINNPIDLFSSQHRLLHLPAVQALQKSPSTSPLYDLLKLLHGGKLQDYRDFTSMPDKSGVFTNFSLDEAECTKNMSLLSLVSLAGEHEEIPYSAIASTLDISEDQVEKWVILGVSSGLMEAKMDQLSKVVIVERCVVRQFGRKEWEALKVRLDKWKVNVRGVLDALKSASEN